MMTRNLVKLQMITCQHLLFSFLSSSYIFVPTLNKKEIPYSGKFSYAKFSQNYPMEAVSRFQLRDSGLNTYICISFNIPIRDTMAEISKEGFSNASYVREY